MKAFIFVVIALVLIGTAFWAGYKAGQKNPSTSSTPVPTQNAQQSIAPVAVGSPVVVVATPTPTSTSTPTSAGNTVVGNRPGNLAPDFRLKDLQGNDVSLRDYLGREAVTLTFTTSGELQFKVASSPQAVTLRDPEDTIHRLYGVSSMPYTVSIDEHGIIR